MKAIYTKCLIFIIFSNVFFLYSCQTKESLRNDIEIRMAKDVKGYFKSSVDKLTFGAGSKFLDSVLDDKMQDTIVLKSFITYVKDDLDAVDDINKLREYKRDKISRNRFLAYSIIKNSNQIKEDLTVRIKIGAMIFDEIIKIIERQ